MDKSRLHKLAGITITEAKVPPSKVTVQVPGVKFSNQLDFSRLLREHREMAGVIDIYGKNTTVTVDLGTEQASKDKLVEFMDAWMAVLDPEYSSNFVENDEEIVLDEGDTHMLYVGVKGSGKLSPQFSDTSAGECRQEFKDSWSNEYDADGKKIKYAHKIYKIVDGETPPKTLEESESDTEELVEGFDSIKSVAVEYKELLAQGNKKEADAAYAELVRLAGSPEEAQKLLKDDAEPVTEVKAEAPDEKLNNSFGIDVPTNGAIKIPAEVKAAVKTRIAEIKAAIAEYDEKGYNDHSQKEKAIECLEQIMDNLSTNDIEGLKKAQIYYSTLMSPITDLFPSKIVLFLAQSLK